MLELRRLPPVLVSHLDLLWLGLEPEPQDEDSYREGLLQIQMWLDFQGSLQVDDRDLADLENLRLLLDELKQADRPQLLQVYAIVDLMESVNRRRDAANFSAQPAVNDLILGVAAYTQGRASKKAVSARLLRLAEYLSNLARAYALCRPQLNVRACQSFDQGLRHLDQGYEMLRISLENDLEPRPALRELSEGAEIMQFFLDWQRDQPEAPARRWTLPVIGARLEWAAEQFQGQDPDWVELVWKDLIHNHLPRLLAFWSEARAKVYLEPQQREEILQEVGLRLNQLAEQLQQRHWQAAETILDELSGHFSFLHAQVLPSRHLQGGDLGDLLELLTWAAEGRVPLEALQACLPGGESELSCWRNPRHQEKLQQPLRWLRLYCREGASEQLQAAIFGLLSSNPPRQVKDNITAWTCPFCLKKNPVGQRQCGNCSGLPRRVW